MKTIWKYELKLNDEIKLEIPEGWAFLSIQVQNDIPCMWVLCDSESFKQTNTFGIYGTGHLIEKNITKKQYLGTFQIYEEKLVFHVFHL